MKSSSYPSSIVLLLSTTTLLFALLPTVQSQTGGPCTFTPLATESFESFGNIVPATNINIFSGFANLQDPDGYTFGNGVWGLGGPTAVVYDGVRMFGHNAYVTSSTSTTITFNSPIRSFGGYFAYNNNAPPLLFTFYDINNVIIGTNTLVYGASANNGNSVYSGYCAGTLIITRVEIAGSFHVMDLLSIDPAPPAITTGTPPADITSNEITSNGLTTNEFTSSSLTTNELTSASLTSASVTSASLTTNEFTSASLTSGSITSSALTTNELTTAPLTSASVTTSVLTTNGLTTASQTSGSVTSSALTTRGLTTKSLTTKAITSGRLTTGRTVSQICSQYSFSGPQGYFCTPGGTGYYQCLKGAYSPSSAQFNCPATTSCKCAQGVECSNGGTRSPCT